NDLPCNGGKPGDPTCQVKMCSFHEHEHPDPNNPANFRLNDTNLHVHGLHVSPQAPQDDVLLTVEPGCRYQVDLTIPKDHPAATGSTRLSGSPPPPAPAGTTRTSTARPPSSSRAAWPGR